MRGMDEMRVGLCSLSCKDAQELARSLPKEIRIGFDRLSKGLKKHLLYNNPSRSQSLGEMSMPAHHCYLTSTVVSPPESANL